MSKKINLEEILGKYFSCYVNDISNLEGIKLSMKEACRQALEIAAENARFTFDEYVESAEVTINKQSILNTLNKIEW